MIRRELLKAIPALFASITFHKKGEIVASAFKVEEKAKYICFVNARAFPVDDFCEAARGTLPDATPVIPVLDGDMDNAVRIYKVSE